MRVLHVLDSLNRGGAEILTLDLCRNSKVNGLTITFVATGGGNLEDDFRTSGVNFIRLQRKWPIDPFIIYSIRKIIKSNKIDIIHTHESVSVLHVYLANLGLKTKCVLTFHGYIHNFSKDNIVVSILSRVMDVNIAVSKGFLQRLKEQANLKINKNFQIVYNGVDRKKFNISYENLKEKLGLSENNILLGMVGNFYSKARDQFTVCQALPGVIKEFPLVRFVFIGGYREENPYLYNRCVDYCRDHNIINHTYFLGAQSNVISVLRSFDCFVFSSLEDSFGIAVVEAMMMGIPSIISDIPPLLEISDNGKYAKNFKTGDHKDLEIKIIELLKNNESRKRLGIEGKKWAIEKFEIEKHIDNLKLLYSELLL